MAPANTWMNGRIVPWEDSALHVQTEAILRGASVFEGVRAYRASDDLLLFRLHDHLHRLFHSSMRFMRMKLQYDELELTKAICMLLNANDVQMDAHIRVVAYFDELRLGRELEAETGVFIIAHEQLVPSQGLVRVTLSPWRRPSDVTMPPRIKASANYVNSRVAIVDAQTKGFDSAIMLNERGKVAEGPQMNLFLVRGGVLITPRTTDGILEGITRHTVMEIARSNSIPVEEREVDATEVYIAEELFFCGTAFEVTPIVEIDGHVVGNGNRGPITNRISDAYFELARGLAPAPDGWITPVGAALTVTQ